MGYYDEQLKAAGGPNPTWFARFDNYMIIGNYDAEGNEVKAQDMGGGEWKSLEDIYKDCEATPGCTNAVVPSRGGGYLKNTYHLRSRTGSFKDNSEWRNDSLGMIHVKRAEDPDNAAFVKLDKLFVPGALISGGTGPAQNSKECTQRCIKAGDACDFAGFDSVTKNCEIRTKNTDWGQNSSLVYPNGSAHIKKKNAPTLENLNTCAWSDKACRDNAVLAADGPDGRFKAGCLANDAKAWDEGCKYETAKAAGVSDAAYFEQLIGWCGQGENFQSEICKTTCTAESGADHPLDSSANPPLKDGIKNRCNAVYKQRCAADAEKPTTDSDSGGLCCTYRNVKVLKEWPNLQKIFDKLPAANQANPVCLSTSCAKDGYKDSTRDKRGCLDSMCLNDASTSASYDAEQKIALQQTCTATSETNKQTESNDGSGTADGGGGGDGFFSKYWIWIAAAIACLLLCSSLSGGAALFMATKK